jgi:6-pyruvoyltetrahydropterin/6-carboxytetrahydropterin synthase
MRICKQFKFEAAHVLPHHPGKCSRLHGHSYRLEVFVDGPLHQNGPAAGMVVDFDEIATVVRSNVIDVLDHQSLNDFLANPTSELIIEWIWQRLAPQLTGLAKLVLWETATACAIRSKDDVSAR